MNNTSPQNINNTPSVSLPQAFSFVKWLLGAVALVGGIYLTVELNQVRTSKDIEALQTEITYLKAKNKEYVELFNMGLAETRNNTIIMLERLNKLENTKSK